MNRIRKQGTTWLLWFTVIFVVSIFAGLGVGGFTSGFGGSGGVDGNVPVGPEGEVLEEFKKVADIGTVSIDWNRFYQMYSGYLRQIEAQDPEALTPERSLQAYNEIVDSAISEEALRAYGKSKGIKVTDSEVRDKINETKAQFTEPKSDKPEDNTVLGEFQRSLGSTDTSEQRWREYLASQGWDDTAFFKLTQDEMLRQKIQKQIEDEVTAKKKGMVDGIKTAVEKQLAAGTSFQDLALLFSYDFYTRGEGGEIPSDLSLGIFSAEFDEVVWKLQKPGDTTAWFETDFGWEIVQLINRIPSEKARTLDEMKQELVDEVRKSKSDEKYEPTEDELKSLYENKHTKMRVRHITLTTMAGYDFAVFQKKLVEATPMKIHHPLVRGYRAVNGLPNERSAGPEPKIDTKMFIPAEDYQVLEGTVVHEDRIKDAIELAKAQKWPQEASWYKPPTDDSAKSASVSTETTVDPKATADKTHDSNEPPIDAAGEEDSAVIEADTTESTGSVLNEQIDSEISKTNAKDKEKQGEGPYVSEPPDLTEAAGDPRYVEAAEAFTIATDKLFKDQASAHFYRAWCYEKWLKDDEFKKDLPITEEEAKTIIEDEYKKAIELYEYEAHYQIGLAQFLADQNRIEDAQVYADKALEYAGLNRLVLGQLSRLYVQLENPAKQAEVETKIKTAQMRDAEAEGRSQQFEVPFDTSGAPIDVKIDPSGGNGS